MNLYLYGHGFTVAPNNTNPNVPTDFAVPNGMTIHFYAELSALFDSSWEQPIVEGITQNRNFANYRPPNIAAQEWHYRAYGANAIDGAQCPNHILTRPGRMETLQAPTAVTAITVQNDPNGLPRVCAIAPPPPVQEGRALAVKQGGKPIGGNAPVGVPLYTYLDRIVAAIDALALGQPIDLHWLACRSVDVVDNEVLDQARDAWTQL